MDSVTDLLAKPPMIEQRETCRPMIVADDVHVDYRVYASGKRVSGRESLLKGTALRGGRELKTIPALRGVTFAASEGETIGVVGHNGSGKSTLFRAMSGLLPASEGAIWARDRPVLLGVNAALVPELSGENNIKLGLLALGFTPEEAAAHVDEIADFAELNEFLYHPMRTYSSGMGARLRFAIASAKAHSILLIDEALSVGDRRFKLKSEQRIRELRDNAGLVMIVSHSVGSLRDTCERVLWVHKGELRADGPADDVIDEYVRWTKQPGNSAVGAASTSSAVAARSAAAPTAKEKRPRRGAESGGIETLVALLSAQDQKGSETTVPRPTVPRPTVPPPPSAVQPESRQTLDRRARFRRDERTRRRRRTIAAVSTGVALLLAVGAGVAIAFLAGAPKPADAMPQPNAAVPGMTTTGPVGIADFGASTSNVACVATEGTTPVDLRWQVQNAAVIALAEGAAETDAIETPLAINLAPEVASHSVPFPCGEETRTYTLTAEGSDGTRTSAAVTVTRQISAVQLDSGESTETTQPGTRTSPRSTAPTTPGNGGTVTTPGQSTSPTQPPATTTPSEPAPTTPPEQPDPGETAPPVEEVPVVPDPPVTEAPTTP